MYNWSITIADLLDILQIFETRCFKENISQVVVVNNELLNQLNSGTLSRHEIKRTCKLYLTVWW